MTIDLHASVTTRIEQALDAIAGQELAAAGVALARLFTAPERRGGDAGAPSCALISCDSVITSRYHSGTPSPNRLTSA